MPSQAPSLGQPPFPQHMLLLIKCHLKAPTGPSWPWLPKQPNSSGSPGVHEVGSPVSLTSLLQLAVSRGASLPHPAALPAVETRAPKAVPRNIKQSKAVPPSVSSQPRRPNSGICSPAGRPPWKGASMTSEALVRLSCISVLSFVGPRVAGSRPAQYLQPAHLGCIFNKSVC